MIDTRDLKTRVDLLDLVGRDTTLRKVAATRGGEYAGPCPSCGGTDRFRVQPERGLWWCRACRGGDRWADAIEYVRWRDGVTFGEAVRFLGGEMGQRPSRPIRPAAPELVAEPSATWRARANAIGAEAFNTLWSDAGEQARAYLHGRGLTDDTILRFLLGYLPRDVREDAEAWGLAGDPIWLPRGIVIPWTIDGYAWALKVRRASGGPKYIAARGSAPVLFGADRMAGRDTLVLAEGEFDAMLLWQETRDLVDVATLGAAYRGIDPRAALRMLRAATILVAYDGDEAGKDGAAKLNAMSGRMRRLELPAGQDVTDYYRAGGDLRQLVVHGAGESSPCAMREAVKA